MSEVSPAIANVSDTALLVAGCRAVETERPDAFVRDPFAARLAGKRGIAIVRALPHRAVMEFGIALRVRLLDELLLNALTNDRGRNRGEPGFWIGHTCMAAGTVGRLALD